MYYLWLITITKTGVIRSTSVEISSSGTVMFMSACILVSGKYTISSLVFYVLISDPG